MAGSLLQFSADLNVGIQVTVIKLSSSLNSAKVKTRRVGHGEGQLFCYGPGGPGIAPAN